MAVVLLMAITGYGQSANPDNFAKMVDILPPAPNAAAMARYGGIALNKNTGTPNISIPLYALNGKKLKADVRLSYASNGIRVDEIASRAGMGWILQGGGVITRTVRGWADETHTRKVPWASVGLNWGTYNYMKELADATFASGADGEPDLFTYSYPGASGSFVFDHEMNVVQVPFKNQIIEHDFTGTAWNFKITDEQGIVYYYGGSGAVEKTKRTSDCAKGHTAFTPTAWYIKKIEHPNGETINFYYEAHTYSYDEGLSETMRYDAPGAAISQPNCFNPPYGGSGAPASGGVVCTNSCTTQGVLLTGIATDVAKIQINYISRSDCEDKLISSVQLREVPSNTLAGYFNLQYSTTTSATGYPGAAMVGTGANLTPYLTTVQEFTADGSQHRDHFFQYNDPASRPARLSYSQDHWGYFNGKTNTTLVPRPSDPQNLPHFPFATANREPDGAFAAKGLLCKVAYPTGGMDSIVYEPNSVWGSQPRNVPHEYTCSVTAVNNSEEKSNTFYFEMGNEPAVQLDMACISTDPSVTNFTHHHVGSVEILSSNGTIVGSYPLAPGYSNFTTIYLSPAGTYQLVIKAMGIGIKTSVTIRYKKEAAPLMANIPVGGLRVKKVLTASPTERPLVKQYHYGQLATPEQSSAAEVQWPEYFKFYTKRDMCYLGIPGPNNHQIGWKLTGHLAMHANSQIGLFNFGGAPVGYTSVIESEGENFENGAVQTTFITNPDRLGITLMGNTMLNAAKSARSNVTNALPLTVTVLKRAADGSLFPIKNTEYTYNLNYTVGKSVWGYTVNQDYSNLISYDTTCGPANIATCPWVNENLIRATETYSMMKYEYPSYWVTNDAVTETVYDQNGQNPIVTVTNKFYENVRHLQLTKQQVTTSEGKNIETVNQYPVDLAGTAVYDAMLAKNILTPLVSSASTENTNPVSEMKINYGLVAGNNIEPVLLQKGIGGNMLVNDGTIDLYDNKGNILQFTGADGIPNAIIWGYNGQYPVAKITGATYTQSIAQLSVTVPALQNLDGASLLTELNRIRTGLPTAQVMSYTYKQFAGVTSITDIAGLTITYNYDGFNRLINVIDQDGNTVKKMDYSFVGATPTPMRLYFNTQQSQVFYNNLCANGFVSEGVTYSVPAGRYFSVVSQSDADAKAMAEITSNGQQYTNRNSTCYNSAACSGVDRRMVGCLCEKGYRVYTNSVNNGNGTFTCTFHYRWSDGFNGPDMTETVTSASACSIVVQ